MDDASTCLWIRLNREPVAAEVAFALELVYGSREIVSNLLLLRVIPHSHTNVSVTSSAGMQ